VHGRHLPALPAEPHRHQLQLFDRVDPPLAVTGAIADVIVLEDEAKGVEAATAAGGARRAA